MVTGAVFAQRQSLRDEIKAWGLLAFSNYPSALENKHCYSRVVQLCHWLCCLAEWGVVAAGLLWGWSAAVHDVVVGKAQALLSLCFRGCGLLQMGLKGSFSSKEVHLILVHHNTLVQGRCILQHLHFVQLHRNPLTMQCKQQTALLDWRTLQKFLVTGCFQAEKQILTNFLELNSNLCSMWSSTTDWRWTTLPLGRELKDYNHFYYGILWNPGKITSELLELWVWEDNILSYLVLFLLHV